MGLECEEMSEEERLVELSLRGEERRGYAMGEFEGCCL
jgi:hypothetical protein